ncbi:E3 ubiquitin-protein ligase Hakai isoform X2 [Denticeps clupeoides]|uniref:E3 ubiquitin-protein ligase Hakai isoform X2 n=1 Tax=Denticeps clupeoides TaxID=299321 RepID=UPI0010A3671A|nr:E3 ubiquitin-protein ligase Hakai-like isoform X2 [Denticeps clupeoides]
MDQNGNDLQGTDGSMALGGLDVRRQIPIKLLSKQVVRKDFGFKLEERFECKSGDAYGSHRRFPQPLFWDYQLNLVGEKDETPVHFCDKCGLPIKIYGRMIPCKHVFCYDCAVLYEKKCDKMCPGCTDPVQRIEQCQRGSLYMCSIVQGCKRTYLSQRDLQAHINHRHMRAGKSGGSRHGPPHHPPSAEPPDRFRHPPPPHLPKPHPLIPPPLQAHDAYGQPPHNAPSSSEPCPGSRGLAQETFRIATVTTRKHSNLITVPIQDDSGSSSRDSMSQAGPCPLPPHHHPGDYPGQPVVSHPHHMMAPPQQQHYAPPPPPLSHPMQHPPPQVTGTPHLLYSQAPPMSSCPPITPPPGHMIAQMPPYMNHPPIGPMPQHGGPPVTAPPPHHYNSMQQDQGTLSPPFSQPSGLSQGLWPAPRGPPRMPGPPPQGPHHPDQSRYRSYYQ